jgi:hypothetical protein
MAELAGALGAGVVVATQAGKLGETLVLSLVVFDAAKAKTVSRNSVQATSLGELPSKLGPALVALVQPLLPAAPVAAAPSSAGARVPTRPAREMSARLREVYAVEAMQVCFDAEERAAWWFCNRKQAFTENVFVRDYRTLTRKNDLDRAEVHRGGNILLPIGLYTLAAAGAAGFATTLVCGLEEGACGGVYETLNLNEGGPGGGGLGPVLLGVSAVAAFGGVMGGVLTSAEMPDPDGDPRDHILTESEGRGAIKRYNAALREKLARDLGE